MKTLRVTLVAKLCMILLMDGDFNTANKMVYGVRMLNNATDHNLMSEGIFSKKNRMAEDGTLAKQCSMTLHDKRTSLLQLRLWMLPTATTE
jgi:hypothetical protein